METVFSVPAGGGPVTTLTMFEWNNGRIAAGLILSGSTLYGTDKFYGVRCSQCRSGWPGDHTDGRLTETWGLTGSRIDFERLHFIWHDLRWRRILSWNGVLSTVGVGR